jgi:hypothetical protein
VVKRWHEPAGGGICAVRDKPLRKARNDLCNPRRISETKSASTSFERRVVTFLERGRSER